MPKTKRSRKNWFCRNFRPIPTEIKAGATPVVGIRAFKLDSVTMELRSLHSQKADTWKPGQIKRSVCTHALAHPDLRPEAACTCGIWSCKSRSALSRAFPGATLMFKPFTAAGQWSAGQWLIDDDAPRPQYFSAQIEQWGRVIEHEDGYRSEFARIIPGTIQVWPRPKDIRKHRKVVNFLRRKYSTA